LFVSHDYEFFILLQPVAAAFAFALLIIIITVFIKA